MQAAQLPQPKQTMHNPFFSRKTKINKVKEERIRCENVSISTVSSALVLVNN